ncbi:MAG TPA: hypothetical protein PLL78_02110 [Fimbriimonadaceae bacterium]|nr:hypothetical protein [Fimbriimonadaceae bacterium]HRJ95453.1 hypothetical protein [Fimbriimonadaceae bacterium]
MLGLFAAAVLAIPLTATLSNAQQAGPQPPPQGGPTQPGFGQPGPGQPFPPPGQMRPGMGGSGVAMIADGGFLYILQGNRLLKIGKEDLKVVKTGELPGPTPPQNTPRRDGE